MDQCAQGRVHRHSFEKKYKNMPFPTSAQTKIPNHSFVHTFLTNTPVEEQIGGRNVDKK
jgi:hypothetical protein